MNTASHHAENHGRFENLCHHGRRLVAAAIVVVGLSGLAAVTTGCASSGSGLADPAPQALSGPGATSGSHDTASTDGGVWWSTP